MPTSVVGEDVIAELVRVAGGCPHGAIVEVGVYKGGTAWHLNELCNKQDRELYLYDTFCGIPFKDEIDPMTVGSFSDTSREAVEEAIPGAKVIAGVFPASAVPMPMIGFAQIGVTGGTSTAVNLYLGAFNSATGSMFGVSGGVTFIQSPNVKPIAFVMNTGVSAVTAGYVNAAAKFQFKNGIASDSGAKHQRAAVTSLGAGASITVTVTWATAFADANYTVSATVVQTGGVPANTGLKIVGVGNKAAASIDVRVTNDSGGALSGTVDCIAMHD
jgi:hypothetical protein